MENWRKHLPPEQMTPEEREARTMELLVLASVRWAQEIKNGTGGEKDLATSSNISPTTIPVYPKRGPVPFGYSWVDGEIITKDEEMKWIRRIKDMALEHKSTEEIAERLNQEDQTSCRSGQWTRVAVWRILKRGGWI